MISYHTLKSESINAGYCRSCLNTCYGIHLEPSDCLYYYYPAECYCCKKMSNILADIRPSSRFKLIRAHKKFTPSVAE